MVTACFVPAPARVTALSAMVVLSAFTEIVLGTIKFAAPLIQSWVQTWTHDWIPVDAFAASYPALYALWTGFGAPVAMFLAPAVSWTGAMFAILRSFEAGAPIRVLGKVVALWAALFVAKSALPHAPVFAGPGFDARSANLWEYVRARHLADVESERGRGKPDTTGLVLGNARRDAAREDTATSRVPRDPRQPALLQAAIERLTPQTPGKTDVYAIGLAGWLDQDVFIKELDGAFAAMGRVLPLQDHTIRLSNYPETLASLPIASRENFAAAIHAVAQVMDKQEDILLLLMTSHGATSGLALQLPGGGHTLLSPDEVAAILRSEGVKNRIVIVSACYGGVFVKPLADDDTIVLTAADERHTSFGCAPGRDWTYFGDALFNRALQPGVDLKYAFAHARLVIAGWESMEGLTPSNPQGHFGPALVDKLAPVLQAVQASAR